MWGITHKIHSVTGKSVLMCNFLLFHTLHTKELRISNIYESLLFGSSVSIFSSSSLSLYDENRTFRDDEQVTVNSFLL